MAQLYHFDWAYALLDLTWYDFLGACPIQFDLGLDRAVGSGAAAQQAAPITAQDSCHVTRWSSDCDVGTLPGPFGDP